MTVIWRMRAVTAADTAWTVPSRTPGDVRMAQVPACAGRSAVHARAGRRAEASEGPAGPGARAPTGRSPAPSPSRRRCPARSAARSHRTRRRCRTSSTGSRTWSGCPGAASSRRSASRCACAPRWPTRPPAASRAPSRASACRPGPGWTPGSSSSCRTAGRSRSSRRGRARSRCTGRASIRWPRSRRAARLGWRQTPCGEHRHLATLMEWDVDLQLMHLRREEACVTALIVRYLQSLSPWWRRMTTGDLLG